MNADHVIYDMDKNTLECGRCGQWYRLILRRSASRMIGTLHTIIASHRDCLPGQAVTVRTNGAGARKEAGDA